MSVSNSKLGLLPSAKAGKEAARLGEEFEQAKDSWRDFFDTFAYALLDYEYSLDKAKEAVRMAAELADLAQDLFEERWRA
jgi:hypothetical protein